MVVDHRRTKRHQLSGARATENHCPKVTEVVSSSAKAKKCDAELARATQRKSGVAQSLKEASVADAEGQSADADPSEVTQGQREAERG